MSAIAFPRAVPSQALNVIWARFSFAVLMVVTFVLYMSGLDRNGWANAYYAAAVEAGATNWKAFFFGSLDASNFITVDKSPAFLWVMEISARLFGFNEWSVLVPQALEGVATVGIVFVAVRRWFGSAASGAAIAQCRSDPASLGAGRDLRRRVALGRGADRRRRSADRARLGCPFQRQGP